MIALVPTEQFRGAVQVLFLYFTVSKLFEEKSIICILYRQLCIEHPERNVPKM
jgi:hypothetical protein